MIGMPIALAMGLARKTKVSWMLFGIGAATFIGSQVVHLPLNWGLTLLFRAIWPSTQPQWWHLPFNAIVLGLTAGLCEETARYIGYRWLIKKAHTLAWRDALMLGAGHGGTEAIILGLLVAITFVNMVIVRGMDLGHLGLTGQNLKLAQQQIAAYWSAPWYMALLGALERFIALFVQVSLAVLVLQVFTRRDWRWLLVAQGYHLIVDAVAVVGIRSGWPMPIIEVTIAPFAIISLGIILGLRPRGEPLIPPEPEPVLIVGASNSPHPLPHGTDDLYRQLDQSKYT
jgi:uncharacterized membrane protein YhfC